MIKTVLHMYSSPLLYEETDFKLTDKEKELVNLSIETSTNSVHSLEETETEASKVS